MAPPPSGKFSNSSGDVESGDFDQRGTLRYQNMDKSRAESFLPVKVEEMPNVIKTFTKPASTHEIFHEHPEWEGAPVSQEDVMKNVERCKKMAAYESLDFDAIDSDLERSRDLNRTHGDYNLVQFWKWFLCILIGFTMGVIAFFVDWGIEVLNTLKYNLSTELITSRTAFWAPFFVYIAFSAFFGLVAGSLVSFVSPLAAGSGIPELKTYLNGIHIRGLLKLKTLVAKLVGIMFSIAGGLIAGKEGPFVHGGGIVGGGLGAMGSKTLNLRLPRKWGGFFRNYADHRDFVAIGTAAGVAVAFSAPVGGLLFAIEEGASFYSTSVFWRGFLSTCTGVGTMHYLAYIKNTKGHVFNAVMGINRDFGLYNDAIADYGAAYHFYMWEMPIFIMMGIVGGILGALFVRLNTSITKFRYKYIPVTSPIKRLVEVVVFTIITGIVFFVTAYASPCQPLPNTYDLDMMDLANATMSEMATTKFYQQGGAVNHFPQLWCKDGEYSIMGQLFFTPLASALRLVIHLGETLPPGTLWYFYVAPVAVLFGVTYILMTLTYGVGAPTGLFVPSLLVGATLGRLLGNYLSHLNTHYGNDGEIVISLPTYAIIGAAANLGGATRMTLSITVLVMETTGALQLITPIMITVFFAKIVGDYFGYGIYDTHIKLRGTPLLDEYQLEAHQKMLADKLTVGELVDQQIVALPPVVPVRMLLDALRNCTHATFPITNEIRYREGKAPVATPEFDLHGVVWRGLLMKMITERIGFFRPDKEGNFPDPSFFIPDREEKRYELIECLEEIPMKMRLKEEQEEVLQTLNQHLIDNYFVDLRPFMRRYPYLMHENAPMSRAYRLFRTMGLRQIFVTAKPRVKGIITRKDIVDDNAMLILGEKAHHGTIKISKQQLGLFHRKQQQEVPILQFQPYYTQEEHEFAYDNLHNVPYGSSAANSPTQTPQRAQSPLEMVEEVEPIQESSDIDRVFSNRTASTQREPQNQDQGAESSITTPLLQAQSDGQGYQGGSEGTSARKTQ